MNNTLIKPSPVFNAAGFEKSCPGYYVHGRCSHGHEFVKEIYCGREWCPVCGAKDSVTHLRRVARWLPKAFQIDKMGYFVFTIPLELRFKFRTQEALSYLRKAVTSGDNKKRGGITGILKSLGYERGLARWHYFGDNSTTFNPHLNVIVDGGRIKAKTLRWIKRYWALILGYSGTPVVNYSYKTTPARKYHSVNYITRATFTDYEYDPELAKILFNFKNTWYWGKWKDEPLWNLENGTTDFDSVIKFDKGICPLCGSTLTWSKIFAIETITCHDWQLIPITAGYYLIM